MRGHECLIVSHISDGYEHALSFMVFLLPLELFYRPQSELRIKANYAEMINEASNGLY